MKSRPSYRFKDVPGLIEAARRQGYREGHADATRAATEFLSADSKPSMFPEDIVIGAKPERPYILVGLPNRMLYARNALDPIPRLQALRFKAVPFTRILTHLPCGDLRVTYWGWDLEGMY